MLPDEVRKAVEYVDQIFDDADNGEWAAVKAHLLAREAEVERLQATVDSKPALLTSFVGEVEAAGCSQAVWRGDRWEVINTRAERAEALLRECLTAMELHPATHDRITAHLSENSR